MNQSSDQAGARDASPSEVMQVPGERPASAFVLSDRKLSGAAFWRRPAVWISLLILVALAGIAYVLHERGAPGQALSVMFGAAFGIVLQRSRFCFLCNFRDWYDGGDPRGLFGILVALGVGTIGYSLVFGAWLPDAASGRLPPDAFIGPVGLALVVAGLVFGIGMAISGSCVSAHLYRLGEGSPTSPFALIGTFIGFILGFQTWNAIYSAAVANAPVVWLPATLGYAGALIATLLALTGIALLLAWRGKIAPVVRHDDVLRKIFIDRWPSWIGGAIVGVLGMVAYLRVAPLGVTAEISGRARDTAQALGVAPLRLEGLDTLRGCVSVVRDALLSNNGAFVLALIVASFAAALVAGQFSPAKPTTGQVVRGLTGGVLLGWGAMTGLGCTVGTLLSGIMAGALSGWVFGIAVFIGVAITLSLGRRIGVL